MSLLYASILRFYINDLNRNRFILSLSFYLPEFELSTVGNPSWDFSNRVNSIKAVLSSKMTYFLLLLYS